MDFCNRSSTIALNFGCAMGSNSHPSEKMADSLVDWYRDNARNLPWRQTTDPYRIWLSEIMLQQTTVRQGEPYYHRFLKAMPRIEALAAAPLDKVLKLWEGLGYYSRARNLHTTAKHIVKELDGQFPRTYADLLKLKGVGPYTAAAIASFSFGLPHVVVDGNVLRVISRLYGIEQAVDIPATKKEITLLAQALLETQDPAEFNQAIMELGALCCTFKTPDCTQCPFATHCVAKAKDKIGSIPFKSKKIKKRQRYFWFYHIVGAKGHTLIQQREAGDVWQGLYQFPLVETEADVEPEFPKQVRKLIKEKDLIREETKEYKQLLTHQSIKSRIIRFSCSKNLSKLKADSYGVIPKDKLKEYAFPRTLNRYKEEQGLK